MCNLLVSAKYLLLSILLITSLKCCPNTRKVSYFNEDNRTKLLVDKKLWFNPIVTTRFLNFRVTVPVEVSRPGVVCVPGEQISILEVIGEVERRHSV